MAHSWSPADDGKAMVFDSEAGAFSLARVVPTTKTIAASSTAQSIDVGKYGAVDITLTANCALTFTGTPGSDEMWTVTLVVRQGGAGSYTVTWPTTTVWPAATAPTLTTTVAGYDLVTLRTFDGGMTWLGKAEGLAFG